MAQSRKRINFFDLPAELRTVIYEHALGQKERIRVPKSASPSLLRTCTQIRNEASSIYYSTNSFQARVTHAFDNRAPGEAENSLKKWLQAIGSKRAGQIEKLHVKYLVSSDGFLSLPREEWAFVFREKDMHDLLGLEEFGVPQEHVVIEFQILSDEY
ncbi:Hypothetical predicted protein [Lecanosticta acicola]|uniref:F-box domain-containing protein n=1 Tax=Lecanosticta acicola TaxID=111012 RepID=A0AAI9EEA5_9PEZI|nr:Hypothetical predicted protein [Lecanosticta acicola]